MPLKELNLTFINDFEYYLRTERKCRTNTIWGYMIVLKHIISIARNSGVLPFNPFAGYINSPESVDRGYLSKEELHSLMDAPMKNKTYELVRDLFLFSVFTGLAYSDVKNLTALQTFFDGNLWIIARRKKTYGAENIVSAVVHLDETTPHIHATMIPIVTGERRKAKTEQTTGKKKYRKKSTDIARLCADDVMSRVRLKEYQNSYAEQMAKYSLQRGIDGLEAKHVTTSQYYRDLLTQSESVQENITRLLEQKEQAEQELSSVKADIKKEKLKNSAADVGATLLDGVGSLFGSSKTKQQQQQIEALEADNRSLSDNIKELNTKIRTMEAEHKTAIDKLSEQLNKMFNYFPHIKELMNFESFCRKVGFGTEMIQRLFNRENVSFKGEIYSHEYQRKFSTTHYEVTGKMRKRKEREESPKMPLFTGCTAV